MEQKKQNPNSGNVSRRTFLHTAALSGAGFTAVSRYVLGGAASPAPSDKLNIAAIGTGGRGKSNIRTLFQYRDAQVIAVSDPNEQSDYSKFYYRGVSGRKPVISMINNHYKSRGYPGCAEYIDFRKMLDKEKHIDAVLVGTPDHVHAVATMAAIKRRLAVYCEKPLTHTISEARAIRLAAEEKGVATQMGNQGHSGEGIRKICEWIWDGAIGDVREVHAWSDTGYWTTFRDKPKETPPVPKGLDWDLWIGPAAMRPYHETYHPYNWRGWWEFGTGAIGDMACHNMDPAFWALKLGQPTWVEASSTNVSRETTTNGTIVRYQFPKRGSMPPVQLTWYDGGLRPPRPADLKSDKPLDGNGIIFKGEKGTILCGGWSNGPRLLPEEKFKSYKQPPRQLPRSAGFMRDWIDAAKGGRPASSNFSASAPMVEVILLGNVATRIGKKRIYWDGKAMKATNAPEAEQYIQHDYRKGWSL